MTGLATAPHLHFEVIVNGAQRNPGTAFSNEGGAPLEASERPRFDSVRVQRLALLEARAPAPVTIVP
jgi:murein DD-endopeptidase MepM/ murein hydrolase activator NlpD